MGKLSKRDISISYMKQHQSILQCPVCGEKMEVHENGRITCTNQHSFDIAKQGYVNFTTKAVNSMYSKDLFQSRFKIINSGLYDRVHEKIAAIIGNDKKIILDAGCGEGTHLVKIGERINSGSVLVGIDLSKEGIVTASKNYEQNIWCVGDLANSPFKEKTFDGILNFLSPANYEEFNRLLKPNGTIIKVVPRAGYLKELRKQAYANSEKEYYSNTQTVERFKEHFSKVDVQQITYTVTLDKNLVPKLLEMTPLGWHVKEVHDIIIDEITIDLDLLVGKI